MNYRYKAKLVRVVDGDTVDLDLDLGFYMTTRQRIRLHGIDAPEKRGKEKVAGKAATLFLTDLLAEGDIEVETTKTGKFGRWLGIIYVGGMANSVNTEMLRVGHAVKYGK